ncbi:GNAT family N-acetyltransferase, partial [Nocardioides sp.]|uniref:GNAT family N-acetyltransferase n=1 Tax=Nocardioides sp. TaxID=35761 RepID=UPI00286D1F26
MTSPGEPWVVSEATEQDRGAWGRLYTAYAASAGFRLSEAHLATVWSWILDDSAQTSGLLLRHGDEPVGLAHWRRFERPLAGSVGCYLDDLFVDDRLRGRGGARELLRHLAALTAARGWTTVRWTTGEG